jgi:hypothetical protein
MHSHGWNIKILVSCTVNWAIHSGTKGLIFYGIAQAHSSGCSNLKQVTYFFHHFSQCIHYHLAPSHLMLNNPCSQYKTVTQQTKNLRRKDQLTWVRYFNENGINKQQTEKQSETYLVLLPQHLSFQNTGFKNLKFDIIMM